MIIDEIVASSRASINKEDLRILLQIALPLQPKSILEIGTCKGYSAEVWIKAFEPAHFLTIEKDTFDSLSPTLIHNMNYIYAFNHDSHTINTYGMLDRIIANEKIDFLFIDGDHSYEGVRKDWEMYGPLVKKGGIVVFHDVQYMAVNPPVEVKLLWDELKKEHKYVEIKTSKSSTGMGVLFI